jgi:hypothetical protein
MADDVGIAVALEAHVPGKLDSAEHQPATHGQPVQVEAGSYTHFCPALQSSPVQFIPVYGSVP